MDQPDAPVSDDRAIYRLETTVDWPPGHTAAYLIDGSEPILIDAGAPDARGRRELLSGLEAHGIEFADVAHLLLTHPHSDHIGQAHPIIEAGEPRVYAPAGVRSRLERSPQALAAGVRETAHEAGLQGTDVDDAVETAVSSLQRDRRLLPPETIDVALTHGQRLSVAGRECTVVHTPGHHAEHVCFYFPETGALFGGDVLIESFRAGALDVGLDRGVYDSFSHYFTAYDRLEDLAVAAVYPGHGSVFTEYDSVIAQSRRDLDATAEAVFEAVADHAPTSALDAALAHGSRDRLHTRLLETLGALGHLHATSRVAALDDGTVIQYRPTDS